MVAGITAVTNPPVTILVGPGGDSPAPSFNATRFIDVESVRIEETGSRETATFECDVLDEGLAFLNTVIGPEGKVLVSINGQQMFRGYVRQPRARWTGISRQMTLTGYDIGTLLDKLIIYPKAKRTANERDKARIQWLISTYGDVFMADGAGGGSGFSKIQTLATESLPDQTFQNQTLRQAIEQVLGAASNSSNYYVDNLGRLHTYDDDNPEADTAPYEINVTPSPAADEVAPDDLEIEWDTSNLVNFWVVRGKNAISAYSDGDSIRTYGKRQAYIDAPDANTEGKRQRVGRAALRDTKNPVARGSFSVMGARAYNGTSRWIAGQKVTVTSAAHAVSGQVYRITRNTITLLNGVGDIRNEIEFGGNKRPFRIASGSGASTALAGASLMAPTAQSLAGSFASVRLTDDVTGAGLVTTNTDPSQVDIDPLTGVDAPTGTDVGFGALFRRQIQTNVLNGDFAVPPPGGVGSVVVSDPADAGYNPLPGWTWTPPSAGGQTLSYVTSADSASGYALRVDGALGTAGGDLVQWIAVPQSQGQQYRVLFSYYLSSFTSSGAGPIVTSQFYEWDASTPIGSSVSMTAPTSAGEKRSDLGLVPPTAGWLRIELNFYDQLNCIIYEVRCALLPAEAALGLATRSSATSAITSTETQVLGITIPAGTFTVGSTYRFTAHALLTSSVANSVTFRMRVGPTTLTGSAAMARALTATTTASNDGFTVSGLFTVRTVGASGTCIGNVSIVGSGAQPFSTNAASSASNSPVSVDTTVANILEFTIQTAAGTTSITVTQAAWECVMAS